MNVQFAIKDRQIYILEVNPRASRTVPFVAKVIGAPIAGLASRIMAGEKLKSFGLKPQKHSIAELGYVAVKEAVFPFAPFRRRRSRARPGDEIHRRGHGSRRATTPMAFAKSQLGAGTVLARRREPCSFPCGRATKMTCWAPCAISANRASAFWRRAARAGILQPTAFPASRSTRSMKARPHIVDLMKNGEVQLVFNTTEGAKAHCPIRAISAAPAF